MILTQINKCKLIFKNHIACKETDNIKDHSALHLLYDNITTSWNFEDGKEENVNWYTTISSPSIPHRGI